MTKSVIVISAPISDRYWSKECEAQLDEKTNKIRCGGAWFPYTSNWVTVDK